MAGVLGAVDVDGASSAATCLCTCNLQRFTTVGGVVGWTGRGVDGKEGKC